MDLTCSCWAGWCSQFAAICATEELSFLKSQLRLLYEPKLCPINEDRRSMVPVWNTQPTALLDSDTGELILMTDMKHEVWKDKSRYLDCTTLGSLASFLLKHQQRGVKKKWGINKQTNTRPLSCSWNLWFLLAYVFFSSQIPFYLLLFILTPWYLADPLQPGVTVKWCGIERCGRQVVEQKRNQVLQSAFRRLMGTQIVWSFFKKYTTKAES